MPSVFPSIRFHCCRKICLRLCGPDHLSKMLLLRREGRHESFTGVEREVRSVFYRQRRGGESARASPGMILAAVHLLEKKPKPAMAEIREGLSGNLCRCTGYMQIFEAVERAAQSR